MGKKRRAEAEPEQADNQELQGKKARSRVIHPQELTDRELEDRERELHETLREARWAREKLRTEPPATNRITWQREVTRSNNAVHKAESLYNEARSELDRRRGERATSSSADPALLEASVWHSRRS